jgi:Putative DNA-binding domain
MTNRDAETTRQQCLLASLFINDSSEVMHHRLRAHPRLARGLAAYRANAGALAERTLAAAYPVVQQLVGDEAFAHLARALWRAHPPTLGDLACWGDALAGFIAAAASLADEPYLPDVARLEWGVHQAQHAEDVAAAQGLEALARSEPAALALRLAPGTALIVSAHPIASIWHAHHSDAADRFAAVRAAFAAQRGEHTLVVRQGWRVQVQALAAEEARFTAALLAGRSLGAALLAAGTHFAFEPWLIQAVREQRLGAVLPMQESAACLTAAPHSS